MRSKILENQVRSGQLSSGHVFGQQATSPRLVWKGRGTQRHSRMCPPLNGRPQHLIEAAKWGRLDQMIFFSAPLTIRAWPTSTVRKRPKMAPIGVKLWENAFQTIPNISFFDVEKIFLAKIFDENFRQKKFSSENQQTACFCGAMGFWT